MTASQVHLPFSTSGEGEPREGLFERLSRATPGGAGHSLRPAVVPVAAALPRRNAGTRDVHWRHARAVDALHIEEDRMRLVAALLVLGTLLVWILFLQA